MLFRDRKCTGTVTCAELSAISATKLVRFARLMNMKFIEESVFYRLRGDYVFPEIDKAWRMERACQASSIYSTSSPGHLAFLMSGRRRRRHPTSKRQDAKGTRLAYTMIFC